MYRQSTNFTPSTPSSKDSEFEQKAWQLFTENAVSTCFETCIKSIGPEITEKQIDCVTKCSERYYETFVATALNG